MVLEAIFSIIIFIILFYIAVRILHSIVFGIVLIAIVLAVSYLIVGVFPDLKTIPIFGQFFNFPSTLGEALDALKRIFVNINIIGTSRDSENNLLITVTNTGIFDITKFKVSVDNTTVSIKNKPKDPLKSKETTTIETDWKGNFTYIVVETEQTKAIYKQ